MVPVAIIFPPKESDGGIKAFDNPNPVRLRGINVFFSFCRCNTN